MLENVTNVNLRVTGNAKMRDTVRLGEHMNTYFADNGSRLVYCAEVTCACGVNSIPRQCNLVMQMWKGLLIGSFQKFAPTVLHQVHSPFTAKSRASNLRKAARWLPIAPRYLHNLMLDKNKIKSLVNPRNPGNFARRLYRKATSGTCFKWSQKRSVLFFAVEDDSRYIMNLGVKLTWMLVCETAMHWVDDPEVMRLLINSEIWREETW